MVATLGRSVARTAELRPARQLDGFHQGEGGRHLISGGRAGEGSFEITKLAFLSGSKSPSRTSRLQRVFGSRDLE